MGTHDCVYFELGSMEEECDVCCKMLRILRQMCRHKAKDITPSVTWRKVALKEEAFSQ